MCALILYWFASGAAVGTDLYVEKNDVRQSLTSQAYDNDFEHNYNKRMSSLAVLDIDAKRIEASSRLDPAQRAKLGQFMTPSTIGTFMASLFRKWPSEVRLLDPGAGVGSLTEAFFQKFMQTAPKGSTLAATAYEIDPTLLEYLTEHFDGLRSRAASKGYVAEGYVQPRDFIAEGTFALGLGTATRFTHSILNPPYKKIGTESAHRKLLAKAGIETVNLYTAFLALAIALTETNGEIVAIIPRSFCNGTYFRPFREWLLRHVAIHHIHVFESRSKAFQEDAVLQENIILYMERGQKQGSVTISSSRDATFSDYAEREVSFSEIVKSSDSELFIYIPIQEGHQLPKRFNSSLEDLGLSVATGPVVDFRVKDYWIQEPQASSVPLLYSHHFVKGEFVWPKAHKKPNALTLTTETSKWLLPKGFYCVTKRFTSKEERRRIVAYVVDPGKLPGDLLGIENHLNVFHIRKSGIPPEIANGLAVYLNSTVVDDFFRTFSGHTQVNATDLRSLHYPSISVLRKFGIWGLQHPSATQVDIDKAVAKYGD